MLRLSYTKWNHQFPIQIFSDQAVNMYTFYQWPELIVFFVVIYVNWWIRCQVLRMLYVKKPVTLSYVKTQPTDYVAFGRPMGTHFNSQVDRGFSRDCLVLVNNHPMFNTSNQIVNRGANRKVKLFIHSIIIIIIMILLLLLTYMNQFSLL